MSQPERTQDQEKWRNLAIDTKGNGATDARAKARDPSPESHPEGVRTTQSKWTDQIKSEAQDKGPRPTSWTQLVSDTRPQPASNDNRSQEQAEWKRRVRPESEKPKERQKDERQGDRQQEANKQQDRGGR